MKKTDYKDLKTLEETFKTMNSDKSKLGLRLIDEAFFLGEVLQDQKEEIRKNGITTTMCQGAYSIERENPALRSYNTSIKNYQSLIKQITELLPIEEKPIEDEFDDFNK